LKCELLISEFKLEESGRFNERYSLYVNEFTMTGSIYENCSRIG